MRWRKENKKNILNPGKKGMRNLEENYKKVVNHIDDIDDENARDNLSDYMDELKEESKNVGRPSGED